MSWFVNARDVHPDVSYWIWQSSKFYRTLVTVVTHFPSALLLHYLNSTTLTYFYTSKPSTLDTHTYLRTCAIIIYLSCLYALNVHMESFVTVGNETAHMFLMKMTWFIIPDFLCSHLCFFCKGMSSCKRTGSPHRAPRECCLTKVSPSACLISQNTKKNFQKAIQGSFVKCSMW